MKNVILIPLYRPGLKHLLLLKSVISACEHLDNVVIYAVADGPGSRVEWPDGMIERLVNVAGASGIELRAYSLVRGAGYPRCYQELMADAIGADDPDLFHFVDQDDYCLPTRFEGRSARHTQASGCIVVDERLSMLSRLECASEATSAVLETPAPGMTYSVPRQTIERYLALCLAHPPAATAAHDFVIGQIAKHDNTLAGAPAASMLYIQHAQNTIGYVRGLPWLFAKLKSPRAVLARTVHHARLVDAIYGGRHWIGRERLHRSGVRSLLYKVILKLV